MEEERTTTLTAVTQPAGDHHPAAQMRQLER
jgi:hypothetical protein